MNCPHCGKPLPKDAGRVKGAAARNANMTDAERKAAASRAAKARWSKAKK